MTNTNFYNPQTGEWNDSLVGEFLWSNVNVSEAVPDVMTPSTWSLWQIYHLDANPIKMPGNYQFFGNICGRPYLNLSLLTSLNQAVGKDVRKGLLGDMVGSTPADLNIPMIPFSLVSVIWTVLPGLLTAQRHALLSHRRAPEFTATTLQWCKDTIKIIRAGKDKLSLLSMWQERIRPKFFQACGMLRSVTMAFSDPATKLRLKLIELTGEADANTIMSNLSGATGDLESLGPSLGLAQVINGKMSRDDYMRRYGHRGPHEMELFASGSGDDPAWFEKLLADFTRSSTEVESLLAGQRLGMENVWGKFQARYPGEAKKFQKRLNQVTAAARNREAVRSEVTRITRLVRQFLLRVGEVTALGDDIFFLTLDEMTDVLNGDRSSVAYIPARRETYSKYSALPPYPAIIVGKFDPFKWAADPNRRSDYFDSRTSIMARGNTIKGFAGAAGCVEEIVRRINRVEDGNQIQPGEILVTVTTNVGWTPLFPRLAAIVTDVGAPLSHAAIVAREMGIPAVVGCGNATMLLKTGDRVRVDGGAGTVTLCSR
jgi:phosphohistidine swiveling domain-containing protein